MGGSWSLCFVQDVLIQRLLFADKLLHPCRTTPCRRLVIDGRSAEPLAPGDPWIFGCVDNAIVWSWDRSDSIRAFAALRHSFDVARLVHRIEAEHEQIYEALGYVF